MADEKKKIIMGVTKIGWRKFKDDDGNEGTINIYYGGSTEQLVNGEFKKEPKFIATNIYLEELNKFLKSQKGETFENVTTEQAMAAYTQLKAKWELQQEEVKKAEEEKERLKQQELDRQNSSKENEDLRYRQMLLNDEISRLTNEKDALTQEKLSLESQRNLLEQQKSDKDKEIEELKNQQEELKNKALDAEIAGEDKAKKWTIIAIVFALLAVLSGGLAGYLYLNKSTGTTPTTSNPTTTVLDVDGEQYQMQINTENLADGQTEIVLYGIATTKDDKGNIVNKAIPLGSINLGDISSSKTSETEEEKSKETSEVESTPESTETPSSEETQE